MLVSCQDNKSPLNFDLYKGLKTASVVFKLQNNKMKLEKVHFCPFFFRPVTVKRGQNGPPAAPQRAATVIKQAQGKRVCVCVLSCASAAALLCLQVYHCPDRL